MRCRSGSRWFAQYWCIVKRLLGSHRRGWEDNISNDLKGTGLKDVDWKHLSQDRDKLQAFVGNVLNVQIP